MAPTTYNPLTGKFEEDVEKDVLAPNFTFTMPPGASSLDTQSRLDGAGVPPDVSDQIAAQTGANPEQEDVSKAPITSKLQDIILPVVSRRKTQESIKGDLASIANEKARIRKELEGTDSISGSDALGTGIVSVLPILLGAALAGKKGAYAGAEAGLGGGALAMKNIAQKQSEKDALSKQSLKDLTQEERDKRKELFGADESIADYLGSLAKSNLTAEAADARTQKTIDAADKRQKDAQQFRGDHPELYRGGVDAPVDVETKEANKRQLMSFGYSAEDADKYSNTPRAFNQALAIKRTAAGIQDSNRRQSQYQMAIDATSIGDVKPRVPDPTGRQRATAEKEIKTWAKVALPLNSLMESYIKDNYSFFGQNAAENKSNFNALIGALKQSDNYGAALTGTELGRLLGQLPPDPSENDITTVMKSMGQGVSPAKILQQAYERLLTNSKVSIEAANYSFPELVGHMAKATGSPQLLPFVFKKDPNSGVTIAYKRKFGTKDLDPIGRIE